MKKQNSITLAFVLLLAAIGGVIGPPVLAGGHRPEVAARNELDVQHARPREGLRPARPQILAAEDTGARRRQQRVAIPRERQAVDVVEGGSGGGRSLPTMK